MRVLVADDEMNVRSALRLLLEQEPDITVTGEVASYKELSTRVKETSPDLILLDWELPGGGETEFFTSLQQVLPAARVVVLSSRPEIRKMALSCGATAFVSKEEPPERLLTVIRKLNFQSEHKSER